MDRCEEYQNIDSLVMAEVTQDDDADFVTGEVEVLAPVAEISKKTTTNSAPKYYDGQPKIVVNSEGSDEVILTVPIPTLDLIAKMMGKYRDPTTGVLMDTGKPGKKYFAIGYRLEYTDGTHRYVWRLKGRFQLGDESAKQIADGTDTTNQQITFTGISTTHKFTYPDGKIEVGKAVTADEKDNLIDLTDWFTGVKTPENISASKVATPAIAKASGAYTGGASSTTISCATAGAEIRYTLDGSEPTAESTLYSTSVALAVGSHILRAKAFASGKSASNEALAWYVISE